jgi:hypothetical protein
MNNLAKPIIFGSLIIALGIFLGAQRIADVVSFEGRWDSCINTFNSDKILKAFNLSNPPEIWAVSMCLKMGRTDTP